MKPRDIFLAILITAIWGFNFVVIKWGVAEVPPLFLTSLRFVASFIPAIFFVPRPTARMSMIALYGLVMGSLQFGLLFVALKLGFSASLSSIVSQLQGFFTMGLAVLLLQERPRPLQIIAAVVAFSGVGVIALTRWTPQALLPLGLAMAAAFFLGVSNIVAKKSGEKKPFSFVIWSSVFALPPLLLVSWLIEDRGAIMAALRHPSLTAIGAIAYLAWGSTLVGYGLWNVLLGRYPAGVVAPFYTLVPVFGIISGVLVLGDDVSGFVALGAALIMAGLLLNVFGPRLFSR